MMAGTFSLIKRVYSAVNPPEVPLSTSSKPIKFGILGAANIAPIALISPAKSHAEVVVYAVAARSVDKAKAFAEKHKIEKYYGGSNSYQELLDDPEVEAVYNPLPNGLHYEWTVKALQAGKHVLLEKPSCDTAAETRHLFELAEQKGLVLLEAFHYRFHPVVLRAKQIVDSGELGKLQSVHASLAVPRGIFKKDNIRFDFKLGGGALMDMGCYVTSATRYFVSGNPVSVTDVHCKTVPTYPDVDIGTTASLAFPNDVSGSIECNLAMDPIMGFIPRWPKFVASAKGEQGEMKLYQFVLPTFYHSIEVTLKDEKGKVKKRTETVYSPKDLKGYENMKGEDWWTTYRYQLEAFVDKLRGRTPVTWVSKEDSIANLEAIEMLYNKAGLPVRPASTFKLPEPL
ncbi:NAD(P)-binding protein [Panus rudis PR-1116 ss-1]|nr:NAD(P)-binding protein [Panus rudis PR-1116 ss-1]